MSRRFSAGVAGPARRGGGRGATLAGGARRSAAGAAAEPAGDAGSALVAGPLALLPLHGAGGPGEAGDGLLHPNPSATLF